MTIQEAHNRIEFAVNKPINGYVSIDDIDLMIDRTQMEMFRSLILQMKAYQDRRFVSQTDSSTLEEIKNHLNVFLEKISFVSTNYDGSNNGTGPNGVLVLPSDFQYASAIYTSGNKYIPVLDEDEIAKRLDSSILTPDATNPVAVISGSGGTVNSINIGTKKKIQFYPASGIAGTIWYYRRPAAPDFVYTLSGRTVTYDDDNSVDPEWDDTAMENIIDKTVARIREHLQDYEVMQYNEAKGGNNA